MVNQNDFYYEGLLSNIYLKQYSSNLIILLVILYCLLLCTKSSNADPLNPNYFESLGDFDPNSPTNIDTDSLDWIVPKCFGRGFS